MNNEALIRKFVNFDETYINIYDWKNKHELEALNSANLRAVDSAKWAKRLLVFFVSAVIFSGILVIEHRRVEAKSIITVNPVAVCPCK